MKSYTQLLTEYQDITNNVATSNQTRGARLMNDSQRLIVGSRAWPFMVVSDTLATAASTSSYEIPARIERLKALTVTVGGTIYTPTLVPSETEWQMITSSATTSDIPQFWFIRGRKAELYPASATTSGTITFYGKRELKDLSIADYTTGGVLTASTTTAIAGTSTVWTTSMAGRYLRITESDTANKGDGFWYEISSVASNTALTLVKPYEGTAITAGNAAYTIGQMPVLPEAYHVLPLFYAAWQYFLQNGDARAASYKLQYDEMLGQMTREFGSASESMVIDPGFGSYNVIDPNDYITL